MRSPITRGRALVLTAATFVLVSLTGCDTAATDTIVLGDVRVDFEFEFDGGSLTVGQPSDVSSNASFNIGPQLSSLGGFTLAEVVSGRLTVASIELVTPTFVGSGIDLRAFNEVVLQLRSGSTVREVASRRGFTSDEPAALNVIQNRDVSTILKAGSFNAVLQVDAAALDATKDYSLEVVMTLSVEVEGV